MSTMLHSLAAASPEVRHLMVIFWLQMIKLEFSGDTTTIFPTVGMGVGSNVGHELGSNVGDEEGILDG